MNAWTRNIVMIRDFYTCQNCGKTPSAYGLQIAHRIKQGKGSEKYIKSWLEKKGYDWTAKQIRDSIIDHPLNVCCACSLTCNDAMNIFFKPEAVEELLNKIMDDLSNPF